LVSRRLPVFPQGIAERTDQTLQLQGGDAGAEKLVEIGLPDGEEESTALRVA
jgi:hypothetical protein